jgi:hypothetical protein
MKQKTIKMMKSKIKEKYSRKYGGMNTDPRQVPYPKPRGPPPPGSKSAEALKLEEEAKKVEEDAKKKLEDAKKKAEDAKKVEEDPAIKAKSKSSGLTENLKAVQRELFAKLNELGDQELANLTTPMIEAVKRISSKPPELEVESGPKKMTTIYDEIDRFLVSLNKTELNGSQIYYIDRLLQYYNSRLGLVEPTPKDKLNALNDAKFTSLRDEVNNTKELLDTSDKFKKQLIKMLANIDKYRKQNVSNPSNLYSPNRIITLRNPPKITLAPFKGPPTGPSIGPVIDPSIAPSTDPSTGSSTDPSTGSSIVPP